MGGSNFKINLKGVVVLKSYNLILVFNYQVKILKIFKNNCLFTCILFLDVVSLQPEIIKVDYCW